MAEDDKVKTDASDKLLAADLALSVPSIALVSEKVSNKSSSSEESGPMQSPVFQKWNNPTDIPPNINFFKFIAATRAWRKQARERRTRVNVKTTIMYENTYKMEPNVGQYFAVGRVETLLRETLEKRLNAMRYSAEGCRNTARELCADIKRKVKEMDFSRYKIISEVLLTENKRQGIQISSRPLWNTSTDNFASYTFRNSTIIAVANVYGVYYE